MKTEDFDDAIRRKMLSINSSHEPQEVNLVHDHIQTLKEGSSNKKYVVIGFLSTFLFVIAGLLIWNIQQSKDNHKLQQTIEDLKADLVRSEIENKQLKKSSEDLFVTKNGVNKPEGVAHKDENATRTETLASTHQTYANAAKNPVTFKNRTNTSVQSSKVISSGLENNVVSSSEDVGLIMQSKQLKGNNAASSSSVDIISDQEPAKVVTAEVLLGTDSLTRIKDFNKPEKVGIDSSLAETKSEESLLLHNWSYRAGLGFEAGNLQLGFSILGEAIYKKHWGLSAGLKMLKNGDETFDDDDDFSHRKKKEFRSTYQSQVPDESNQHIRIRNTVFQVPLNLNYYLPVKNNFAFLFGLGTDIDIYIKQHVEYNHALSANDIQNRRFETNYSPVYFNNAVISAGIEKNIRSFAFQICPYVSPQLNRVTYKKENMYYGLRLRVLYKF